MLNGVNGCFCHGRLFVLSKLLMCLFFEILYIFIECTNCYARHTVNPVKGKTMQDLYQDTVEKVTYLKEHGYNMVDVWEFQIKQELELDEEMKSYFDQYEMTDPLEPGDALFGGQTNVARLYHCEEDEKMCAHKTICILPTNFPMML